MAPTRVRSSIGVSRTVVNMPIDLEAFIEDITTVLGVLDVDADVAKRTAVDIVSLPSMIELRRLAEMGETVEG
jgi:hypothetical protein